MKNESGIKILGQLSIELKNRVSGLGQNDWKLILKEVYEQFQLTDKGENWLLSELNTYSSELRPTEFGREHIENFLDETRNALEENNYFLAFLAKFDSAKLNLPDKHLPHLLVYAFVLDRLNKMQRKDIVVLDKMIRHYWKTRRENNFYRISNILAIIKLHSIELPVVLFLRAKKLNRLRGNFAKFILSFNIFEATLVDFFRGFWDNALSTIPLIRFHPNYRPRFTSNIAGAPATFTEDGLALNLVSPCPREWADLYQVWNMAFVVQFDQPAYLLTKLLIPSVSKYKDRATEYMHTRITALHLAMNYLDSATQSPKISIDLRELGPAPKSILLEWGKVNLECSKEYSARVNGTTKIG